MKIPDFLTVSSVEGIHKDSITRFGGTLGLRERAALESAVMHPQNVYFYVQGDLFDIAAAYAFHIAEAQCCLDGNKRTAMGSALVFLEVNGVFADYDEWALYDLMIRIAEKSASKTDLAAYLRKEAGKDLE